MFERFTKLACAVVTAAVEEAEQRFDRHVGTEHLLLGLARTEAPIVAATLRDCDVGVGAARAALAEEDVAALAAVGVDLDPHLVGLERTVASGAGGPARRLGPRDHRPFTGGAKQVLRGSLTEAKALGHRCLWPGHILLALSGQPARDPALRLLERLGTDPDVIRRELTSRMSRIAT